MFNIFNLSTANTGIRLDVSNPSITVNNHSTVKIQNKHGRTGF